MFIVAFDRWPVQRPRTVASSAMMTKTKPNLGGDPCVRRAHFAPVLFQGSTQAKHLTSNSLFHFGNQSVRTRSIILV